ncbi:hypothetical protein [Coleofasciculus sp. E1-EBD-02]|uniref:hypothetical protein n=1 Tax=Coleofasciculus sp. E1-EBD-02 TaxID=3068481 RepID=UPI0032F45FC3
MTLILWSITLLIALIAFYLSIKVTEEIERVAAVLTALICLIFCLFFAPLPIKIAILLLLLLSLNYTVNLISRYISSDSD